MHLTLYLQALCLGLIAASPLNYQILVSDAEVNDYPEAASGFFEGDIELPMLRNAIRNPNRKWPGNVVYYHISSAYPSNMKSLIVSAMREMEANTKHGSHNCVHFVERTTQRDYVSIVPHSGCHSKIGRQGGPQELSLTQGCMAKGTIMHELLHALGFWHEQNRYDRDTYVTIHMDNVNGSHTHDFDKHSTLDMDTLGTAYDYGSIMHYGPYTFAVDASKPTISPKSGHGISGVTMGQRLAMSKLDVQRVQMLYGCTVDTTHIAHPDTSQYIIDCNFDTDLCQFSHDSHDNFNWRLRAGGTSTAHTGPTADHTSSAGHYIYAEANRHHNRVSRLISPTVAGGSYCIDFWLFQHGAQEGNFQVRAGGTQIREQPVRTITGNKDNAWFHYRISLQVPVSFHIILQATIGSGDQSDIALDDFLFYQGHCP